MVRRIFGALAAALVLLSAGLAPAPSAAQSPSSGFEYHVGSGDKLRVIVFGEESLTGEFFVSGSGSIAFPLVGEINVQGKTIPQVQAAIEEKLRDGYGDAGYYYRSYRKYYVQ